MYKKIAFICIVVAGCSSSESAEHSEHSGGEQAEHVEHAEHSAERSTEHGGEHRGPPEVLVPYHDVLAPVWHSEAGEVRADLACAAATDLIAQGEALAAAPAPNENPEWVSGVSSIVSDARAIVIGCRYEASDPEDEASLVAEKEEALLILHDQFHRLVEIARE